VVRRKLGVLQWVCVAIVRPTMTAVTKRTWRGMEHIPSTGPAIIVANHVSHADPFTLAHYVFDAGRWPVFLAKQSVFTIPVLGRLIRAVKQVPVARGTADAVKALDAAIAAVQAGECVIVYPEGTTSKEPDLWPMRGKTGIARLWLATGAPVIPVCMWGPEQLFDPRTRRLRLLPRPDVSIVAGPPIDLSAWAGAATTATTLQEITDHCMLVVRDMLATMREGAPPPLWTPPRRSTAGEA
jgi:1-acyl-sn-glycerol-3-phosphate acyltransferase